MRGGILPRSDKDAPIVGIFIPAAADIKSGEGLRYPIRFGMPSSSTATRYRRFMKTLENALALISG